MKLRQFRSQLLRAAHPMWARWFAMTVFMITMLGVQAQSDQSQQGRGNELRPATPAPQTDLQMLENDRKVQVDQDAKLKQTMQNMAIPEGAELSPEKRAYLMGLQEAAAAGTEANEASQGTIDTPAREGTERLAEPVDNLEASPR